METREEYKPYQPRLRPRRMKICLWACAPLLFLPPLFAEEDDAVIVVSAGKIEQSADDAAEKVLVVTSEEIREIGAKTLTEAMKTLPGVVVTGASAANPVDSISMQGFDSDYVKILIDGVAVSGDIGGSVAAFQLPVEDIERIEVVQGASSALYGSDAMGGVINIILKRPELSDGGLRLRGSVSDEFSAMTGGNVRNYAAGSASLAGRRLNAGLSAAFDYTPGARQSGYNPLAGETIDYYLTPKRQMLSLRGTAGWSDWWGKAGVYCMYVGADQISNYTAVGFNSSTTMEYDTKRVEGGVNGDWNISDSFVLSGFSSGKFYLLDTDYESSAGADSSSEAVDSNFIDWESELRGTWNAADWNSLLFGVNANLQTIDGDSFSDGREKQALLSAYAQDSVSLARNRLLLVPGVRFDFAPAGKNASSAFSVTPKFSFKWNPTDDLILRLAYGMGYKVPTLKQKYWSFNHNYAEGEGTFILYGNPELHSERSQSVSAGADWTLLNLVKFSLSAYFNYISDMIDSVVTDAESVPQVRTYQNIDKAMTYGGAVSVSSKLDRFDVRAGYAYTAAKQYDKDADEWLDMALRVAHRVTLSVGYLIPAIDVKAAFNGEWNSPRLIVAGSDSFSPDLLLAGVSFSKKLLSQKLECSFRVDNMLNNLHCIDGTDGKSQKDYFGLNDGVAFSVGAKFMF